MEKRSLRFARAVLLALSVNETRVSTEFSDRSIRYTSIG